MRTALYALRDKLTNTFYPPFHATHDVAAVRGLVAHLNNAQAKTQGDNVANYPAEHELVRLAAFDDIEGVILTDARPVILGRCDTFAKDSRYFPQEQTNDA